MKVATLPRLRPLIWSIALLAAPLALPMAALAQQTGVEDSSTIDNFRLDQPAGPGTPVRTQPPVQQPATPTRTPASPPSNTPAQPTTRPAARPAAPTVEPRTPNSATNVAQDADTAVRQTEPDARTPAADVAPSLFDDEASLPAVSETIPDDAQANDTAAASDAAPVETATDSIAKVAPYWPYALGGLAVLLISIWFVRRRRAANGDLVEESEGIAPSAQVPAQDPAEAPALDLTQPVRAPLSQPAAAPPPERKGRPPGTIGVSAAKLFGTPPAEPSAPPVPSPAPAMARPSAASQGFVTTRAPKAELIAAEPPRRAAPSGTVGIPASRIALPEPPPPAIALVEGTQLAAQFAAPELIRDTDGLRLKFALGIGNLGNMVAKDLRIRTVLLTAAPDSDRAIAEWMANPKGPAAATIPHIDGGTQTNITGDIKLNADQIRAMSMQGNAIFVPMFAISIDFMGAEGLDRFGEAYVIGLPPERASSNGAARVLPLPHDENLPRRWTDLVHSRANIGG